MNPIPTETVEANVAQANYAYGDLDLPYHSRFFDTPATAMALSWALKDICEELGTDPVETLQQLMQVERPEDRE